MTQPLLGFSLTKQRTTYTAEELGLYRLKKTEWPVLPNVFERTEVVGGRNGRIDYGGRLRERSFDFYCAIVGDPKTPAGLMTKKSALAGFLIDHDGGPATLQMVLDDFPGVTWDVSIEAETKGKKLGPFIEQIRLRMVCYAPFGRAAQDETSGTITTSPGTLAVSVSGTAPTPGIFRLENVGGATVSGPISIKVRQPIT